MATFADLLLLLRADTSDIDKKLQATRQELTTFGSQAIALGSSLSNLGTSLTGALTIPLAAIGAATLKLSGDLEQNRIAFTTMLGSADQARIHLEQLRDFAQKTPFEFTDLVQASKKLQALGFAAGEVIPTLTAIGNATAALGTGAEGIDRITLAFGQMLSKGTVQSQEMKQLAEAGIPAWQILAKTLNVDVAEAMKLVEKRAVDSGTAVPAILAGINERFGGLMQAQNQTLLGQLSNLKDRTVQVLSEIGDAMAPTAKRVVDLGFQIVSKIEEITKSFQSLPQPVKDAAFGLGAFAAALGPAIFIGGQMFSAVGNLAKGFSSLIPYLVSAGLPAGFAGIATAGGIAAAALVALAVIGPKLVELAGNVKALISAISDSSPIKTFMDLLGALGKTVSDQIPIFGKIKQAVADSFKWQDLLGPLPRALDAINQGLNSVVDKTAGMGDAIAANLHKLNISAEQTSKSWEDNLARKAAAAVDAMRAKAEEAAKAIKEAFSTLDIKDVSLETKKISDAFALLSQSGVASTDELSAASENLRVKLVELRESVNQAPLKALGVSETVGEINIALANFSVLNDRLLAGKIAPEEYAQAFQTVTEKLQKFKDINDKLITAPFADMLEKGNKKLLEQIGYVQALGEADKSLADFQLNELVKKQTELADSIDLSGVSIHSVDSILKAFGQKTVQETADEIKILKQRFDDANAAMKVGIPGAALAARIALEELYRTTHDQQLFDEQSLGITDLGLLKIKLGDAEQAYINLARNGVLTATQAAQAQVGVLKDQITYHQQLGDNTTMLQAKMDGLSEALKHQNDGWVDLAVAGKRFTGDIGDAFKDIFTNAKDLGPALLDAAKTFASVIFDNKTLRDIRTVINTDLTDALKGLITGVGDVGAAFAKLGTDVLDIILNKIIALGIQKMLDLLAGVGGTIGSIGTALGGVAGGIAGAAGQVAALGTNTAAVAANTAAIAALTAAVGGSAVGTAAGGVAEGVGGVASAGSGAAGGVAAAVGGTLTATIGAVAGVVTAISSVIGNFQMAHQETSLNAIESNTRVGALYTLAVQQWVQGMAEFIGGSIFPELKGIMDWQGYIVNAITALPAQIAAEIRNFWLLDIVGRIADIGNFNWTQLAPKLDSLNQAVASLKFGGVSVSPSNQAPPIQINGKVEMDGGELFRTLVTWMDQNGKVLPGY